VFAESEVISWLGRGKKVEDILLGVHRSIVSRSLGLMRRVGVEPDVTFTGGVTKNVGMVQGLNDALGFTVNVSDESHFIGAIGAALFARDQILGSRVPSPAEAAR
jgi:activator of 2-hydroxyglutaryl-CoA dehydratase